MVAQKKVAAATKSGSKATSGSGARVNIGANAPMAERKPRPKPMDPELEEKIKEMEENQKRLKDPNFLKKRMREQAKLAEEEKRA